MLYGLEPRLQKRVWTPRSIWDVPRAEIGISDSCPSRGVWDLWQVLCLKDEGELLNYEHVLRVSGYYNHLNQVGVNLLDKIVIDRVLWSLSPSYWNFVMNYNMQGMTKTIPKLFVMLKSTKVEIKKSIKCWWLTRPLVSRKGQREEGELQEE